LWVDEDFEMTAVGVKGIDPKRTWEIIGIYRAPIEDLSAIEKLAARTLPYIECKGERLNLQIMRFKRAGND
jgi:hypothetical protein